MNEMRFGPIMRNEYADAVWAGLNEPWVKGRDVPKKKGILPCAFLADARS